MAATKATQARTRANTAKAKARAVGAKQPADHQSASNDVVSDIVEFEYEGVIYEIDTDKFDDLEIVESLQSSISRGLRMLIGSEQYHTLVEQLKAADDKGILRVSKTREFVERMQESVGPLV